MQYGIVIVMQGCAVDDKRSNDSLSNDARFIHKLSTHTYIKQGKGNCAYGKQYFAEQKTQVADAPWEQTFLRDVM